MTLKLQQNDRSPARASASRSSRFYLPLILLLALAVRLLLWNTPLHQPANDEVEYITVARDLLAGRGWQFYEHYHWLRAPLYPLFLAGSLLLAGVEPPLLNSAAALHRAALPNIALSVATVYLGYRLALDLVGRRAALLAALFGALLWTLATFASLYMSETLFTFLFTGALLCLARPAANRPSALALGGVLFGLATLTRSITLAFLPFVALWLLLRPDPNGKKNRITRAALLRSGMFVLCAILTIAPWTIRNYAAYGRLIPVETGLSYNLWAFNEPRESGNTIFTTLENIRNPAERSDYATAKGLARLREDPAILMRKLPISWIYLWHVKPIEDRFLMENYYSDVGLPLFLAALLFDDALYFAIVLAAIAGLALYRRPPATPRETAGGRVNGFSRRLTAAFATPKGLLIAWLLYAVGTMLLTHSEGRYRHFLFPVLIPYAAWSLTRIGTLRDWKFARSYRLQVSRSAGLLVFLLWALIGGTFLAYYPWSWAAQNLARGWHAARAELAWARGDRATALAEDQQAIAEQETVDGWLRLGDHARASGDMARALKAYYAGRTLTRNYPPGVAKLGDMLRASGDERKAREVFATDDIDLQQLVDRTWRDLRPAPRMALAVGDGLDFGYISGVYPAETLGGVQARWTNGHALVRLGGVPAAEGAPKRALLRLRLAAPQPGKTASAAQICAASQCWPLALGPTWRTYTVMFDVNPAAPLLIELRSETFHAGDGRKLGMQVDEVAIVAQ